MLRCVVVVAVAMVTALSSTLVAGGSTPPASLVWVHEANSCAFRQTDRCDGKNGPRMPQGDRACDAVVPCDSGECPSGYCDCGDGKKTNPVDCHPGSHKPFKCADVCSSSNASGPMVLALSNGFIQVLVCLLPHKHAQALQVTNLVSAPFHSTPFALLFERVRV